VRETKGRECHELLFFNSSGDADGDAMRKSERLNWGTGGGVIGEGLMFIACP